MSKFIRIFLAYFKAIFLYKEFNTRSFFTKQNLQSFLERETISEFLNVDDFAKTDKDIGIYYCKNGYRGYAFEVFPPARPSYALHDEVLSMVSQVLPNDTAIQIIHMPSRNIEKYVSAYQEGHQYPKNIGNPENVLNIINSNAVKYFIASHLSLLP